MNSQNALPASRAGFGAAQTAARDSRVQAGWDAGPALKAGCADGER